MSLGLAHRTLIPIFLASLVLFLPTAEAQNINELLRILLPPSQTQPVSGVRTPGEYAPPRPPPQFPTERSPSAPRVAQVPRAEVLQLQRMLNDLGYDAGVADGVAGRKTLDALNAFRRANGISASSTIDSPSVGAVSMAHRGASSSSPVASAPTTLESPATAVSIPASVQAQPGSVKASGSDLQDLASAPPGLQPVTFRYFDGMPILQPRPSAHLFSLMSFAHELPAKEQECHTLRTVLLTEDVVKQFMGEQSYKCWLGKDEFQAADTRRDFYARYLEAIKSFAPKPPFRMVFTQRNRLGQYDADKGQFRLAENLSQGLTASFSLGSSLPLAMSVGQSWPEPVLAADEAAARDLLEKARSWAQNNPKTKKEFRTERDVSVVGVIDVLSADYAARRLDIGLVSLSLYDPELQEKVYDFPIPASFDALIRGKIPERLKMPSPAPLDTVYALVQSVGLDKEVAEGVDHRWRVLYEHLRQRDQAFYAALPQEQLSDDDVRLPVFSLSAGNFTDSAKGQLERWAAAYRAGLPDELELVGGTGGRLHRDAEGKQYVFSPLHNQSGGLEGYAGILEAEGLQTEQVVRWSGSGDVRTLLVAPNRIDQYWLMVDQATFPNVSWRQRAVFRAGPVKRVNDAQGKPILLVYLEPIKLTVESDDGTIAERIYQGIPHLDGSFVATEQPSEPSEIAGGPLSLSPALLDLLIAKTVSPAVPSTPVLLRVGVSVPDRYLSGHNTVDWSVLGCSDSAKRPLDLQNKIKRDGVAGVAYTALKQHDTHSRNKIFGDIRKLEMIREFDQSMKESSGVTNWTPEDDERLVNLKTAAGIIDRYQPIGDICGLSTEGLGYPNPAGVYLQIQDALPGVKQQQGAAALAAEIILEITGMRREAAGPHFSDLLPPKFVDAYKLAPPERPPREAIIFESRLKEVVYFDGGGQEVARLSPDKTLSIQGHLDAVRNYESAQSKVAPAAELDLVGIKLGMTLEEAEKIIREHMDVGRVLEGKRLYDGSLTSGQLIPATSGKLFISKDERELIAILDEPPVADGKVLAAWRRVYIPGATVSMNDASAALYDKYGEPTVADKRAMGMAYAWRSGGRNDCMYAHLSGARTTVAVNWREKGERVDVKIEGGVPTPDARLPAHYRDPFNPEYKNPKECGPVMSAEMSFEATQWMSSGVTTRKMDWIEQRLTDITVYMQAFNASREASQTARGNNAESSTPQERAGGLKF